MEDWIRWNSKHFIEMRFRFSGHSEREREHVSHSFKLKLSYHVCVEFKIQPENHFGQHNRIHNTIACVARLSLSRAHTSNQIESINAGGEMNNSCAKFILSFAIKGAFIKSVHHLTRVGNAAIFMCELWLTRACEWQTVSIEFSIKPFSNVSNVRWVHLTYLKWCCYGRDHFKHEFTTCARFRSKRC